MIAARFIPYIVAALGAGVAAYVVTQRPTVSAGAGLANINGADIAAEAYAGVIDPTRGDVVPDFSDAGRMVPGTQFSLNARASASDNIENAGAWIADIINGIGAGSSSWTPRTLPSWQTVLRDLLGISPLEDPDPAGDNVGLANDVLSEPKTSAGVVVVTNPNGGGNGGGGFTGTGNAVGGGVLWRGGGGNAQIAYE